MRNLHTVARYWTQLVPQARRELAAWGDSIEAMTDPAVRSIARTKFAGEKQNVESAAFFALLADDWRSALQRVVRFQLTYELLDGLNERSRSLQVGLRLHGRLLGAAGIMTADYDGALALAVRDVGEAQARNHAAIGLREWAEAYAPQLHWWEAAAAGISSLRVLAMLCSPIEQHGHVRTAYLETDALAALLDALVDLPDDRRSGNHNWLDHYEHEQHAAWRLETLARDALGAVAHLPRAHIHRMLLEGLLAHNLASVGDHAPIIRLRLLAISPLVRTGTRILRAREVLHAGTSQLLPIGNARSAWQDER